MLDSNSQAAGFDNGSDDELLELAENDLNSDLDAEYIENHSFNTLFTDGIYVYANGQSGIYRIDRDENATAELIFTPESGIVYDFVIYENAIYYILENHTKGKELSVAITLCRYDTTSEENIILDDNIDIWDIALRGFTLYKRLHVQAKDDSQNPFPFIELIYQINNDGTLTKLETDPYAREERRYFTEYNDELTQTLYSESVDGADKRKLATILGSEYTVANEKIFYWVNNTADGTTPLFSINPDGTDAKSISQDRPNEISTFPDKWQDSAEIVDYDKTRIYLSAHMFSDKGNSVRFFSMNYDGTDHVNYPQLFRNIDGDPIRSFDVMDEWIYYREYYDGPLFRIRVSGSVEPQIEPFIH